MQHPLFLSIVKPVFEKIDLLASEQRKKMEEIHSNIISELKTTKETVSVLKSDVSKLTDENEKLRKQLKELENEHCELCSSVELAGFAQDTMQKKLLQKHKKTKARMEESAENMAALSINLAALKEKTEMDITGLGKQYSLLSKDIIANKIRDRIQHPDKIEYKEKIIEMAVMRSNQVMDRLDVWETSYKTFRDEFFIHEILMGTVLQVLSETQKKQLNKMIDSIDSESIPNSNKLYELRNVQGALRIRVRLFDADNSKGSESERENTPILNPDDSEYIGVASVAEEE